MEKKTCLNCSNSCYLPTSMKTMYSVGGEMLMCCKPKKRKQNGVMLVAPDYKCRNWLTKPEEED